MASPRCPSCIEHGAFMCTGCKNVKYCSVYCQQTDWQFHKVLCKTFKKFETRPSPDMRRVIYFPAEKAKPEFMWLPLERTTGYEDEDGDAESINYGNLMGDGCNRYEIFSHNNILDVELDTTIQFFYDDNFMGKYPERNKAAMLATNNKMGYSWKGPMIAYCGQVAADSDYFEINIVSDMDMKTFSDLIVYLIDYENQSPKHILRKGPKIKAAKTNCDGEQKFHQAPFVQSVEIPRMHPICDKCEVSQVSKNVGMPLLLLKDTFKKYPETTGVYCNPKVTSMQMSCDTNSEINKESGNPFGCAPRHWLSGQVPNVLIARSDLKPLEMVTVEAFGDFCQYHLVPYFQWHMESTGSDASANAANKEVVMKKITPKNWDKFLSQWRMKKAGSIVEPVGDDLPMGLDAEKKKKLENRLFGFCEEGDLL